jgi:hypothetical protein
MYGIQSCQNIIIYPGTWPTFWHRRAHEHSHKTDCMFLEKAQDTCARIILHNVSLVYIYFIQV